MRNMIFGIVAGLLAGTVGALAYSHYFGDGSLLADLQSQLDSVNAKLAKTQADQKFLKEQYNSETDQLNQVLASKQAATDKIASPADAAPVAAPTSPFDPNLIRGIMGMMSRGGPGGFRSPEQRMLVMQKRLNLTPDQAKAIRAAMDADEQARRDAFRTARQNHQPPDLSGANTLEQTLDSVLSPSQQVQYQQLQGDEKAARAETTATTQIDNLMPLLQLSDDQKEKAMNALYQQQLSAPDPMSLMGNPNALTTLSQQGQTTLSAMKQVLTPDQYALYQQNDQIQQQAFANFGGGRNRGNTNGGNGGPGGPAGQGQAFGGTASGGASTATTASSAPAVPTTGTTTDSTGTATSAATGTTTDASSSTNAPTATTNAAPANPPTPGT